MLRILSKKSVLNLGFSSNGPLIEYATLREYLNSNVKKVLWIYYNNDIQNLENELILNMKLKNYLKDLTFTQNLKLSQKEIDNMGNTIIEKHLNWKKNKKEQPIIYFIKLNKIRSILNRYLPKTYQPHPQLQPKPQTQLEFKKILKMAKDLTSKKNSQLYFIHIPGYSRYTKEYNDSNYIAVKKIVNELDIPFIDIHNEVFEKEQNPLELYPFKLFGHYNVEGYRKVAEAIYKFTKN